MQEYIRAWLVVRTFCLNEVLVDLAACSGPYLKLSSTVLDSLVLVPTNTTGPHAPAILTRRVPATLKFRIGFLEVYRYQGEA